MQWSVYFVSVLFCVCQSGVTSTGDNGTSIARAINAEADVVLYGRIPYDVSVHVTPLVRVGPIGKVDVGSQEQPQQWQIRITWDQKHPKVTLSLNGVKYRFSADDEVEKGQDINIMIHMGDLDAAYTAIEVFVNCQSVGKEYLDLSLRELIDQDASAELNPAMRTASGRGVDDVLSHTGCDMMMNDDSMERMAADEPMTSSQSNDLSRSMATLLQHIKTLTVELQTQ
ncbi:hypothetical protein CAPTEDRAFT_196118, partial [Capitella teleta]